MKKIIFCLLILVAFTSVPALAESGHDHSGHDHCSHEGHDHGDVMALNQNQVMEKASGYVARLVEKGKLDTSWETITPQEAKENDAHEWVVTFSNPEIKDPEKQTLYMFLTLSGKYIAANFTGQ